MDHRAQFKQNLQHWLLGQAGLVLVVFASSWLLGHGVLRHGMSVAVTRKLGGLIVAATPFATNSLLPVTWATSLEATLSFVATMAVYVACIGSFALRRETGFLATCFASFDRPEDRPHTLNWLMISTVACYAIITAQWLWAPHLAWFMLIALFVSAFGDGLAEPVGAHFGRHRYAVKGFMVDRVYTRSLEGSACVLISGLVAIALFKNSLTPTQFWAAMLTLPAILTLAEARSPHTMDQPAIYAITALAAPLIMAL